MLSKIFESLFDKDVRDVAALLLVALTFAMICGKPLAAMILTR